MNWYLSLDINRKIQAKGYVFELATGIGFQELSFLFSFKERIEILQNKLKIEGII
jgi:hypothetical protein